MDKDKVLRKSLTDLERAVRDIRYALETFVLNEVSSDDSSIPETKPISGKLHESQVAAAFAKRYEAHMNAPWFPGPHGQHVYDLTQLLNACPDPRASGKLVMDIFFDDPNAEIYGFAMSHLVKQFGKYLQGTHKAQEEAERQERVEDARRRHEQAKAEAEAQHAKEVAERAAQKPLEAEDKEALSEFRDWLESAP